MYDYFTRGTKIYYIGTDGKHYMHDSAWGAVWAYYNIVISTKEYVKAYHSRVK